MGSSSRYHLKTTTRNLLTSQNHHSTKLKLKQGKLSEYKMFDVLKALEGTIHPIEIPAAYIHNLVPQLVLLVTLRNLIFEKDA